MSLRKRACRGLRAELKVKKFGEVAKVAELTASGPKEFRCKILPEEDFDSLRSLEEERCSPADPSRAWGLAEVRKFFKVEVVKSQLLGLSAWERG